MVLCVTGPMASGKNAVCDILERRGFASLDADRVVHEAVEAKKGAILEAFGEEASAKGIALTDSEGRIARRSLARLVFASGENLSKQESIVFPYVDDVIRAFIEQHEGHNVTINAVVLYKVPAMRKADAVLYVDAPWGVRLRRVRLRDGMGAISALKRFRAQRGLYAAYRRTGVRILRVRNTGDLRALEMRTECALDLLNK